MIPESGPLARRASSDQEYLDSTGQTQIACQKGSIFRLVGGLLFFNGDPISVSSGVSEQQIGSSANVEAIDSIFAIAADGTLFWNNAAFDNGTARFGTDPTGLYGVFHGFMPSQLTAVSLKAIDRKFYIIRLLFLVHLVSQDVLIHLFCSTSFWMPTIDIVFIQRTNYRFALRFPGPPNFLHQHF